MKTNLKPGDIVYLNVGGEIIGKARVTEVKWVKVSDLTEEDLRQDGFKSFGEFYSEITRYYKKLRPDSRVVIIRFRIEDCR